MTAHLHNPVLRLVSLHPHLSIHLAFLRVPEIHDDFRYKVFISKTTTIHDVINSVTDELGLTKSLPVPGGGNLEYVLEECGRMLILKVCNAQLVLSEYTLICILRIYATAWILFGLQYHRVLLLCQPIYICGHSRLPFLCPRRVVPSLQIKERVNSIHGTHAVYHKTPRCFTRVRRR